MVENGGRVWFGRKPMVWFGIEPMVRYGLVADGLHDPAGLQRVVEEEVVVRRVLVRDGLKKRKNTFYIFLCSLQCCGSGIFILDPGSEFFHPVYQIPDPGPKRFRIPDPHQII
jgi:hypothetical protein